MPKTVLEFEKPVIELEQKIAEMRAVVQDLSLNEEIDALESKVDELRRSVYSNLTRWQKVQLARHPDRPYTLDYIKHMTEDFVELHGDRAFGDDHAIVGGFARIEGRTVMLIGQQKGRDTKSNLHRNFGMANPEGYRKALRQMKLAEKFGRPVICFVDTSGAYCGMGAEERGQGQAIAENLTEMMALRTPVISVVIGEGGSGGALALAVADEVWMLENAYYSVISPEGCASILWKDSAKVEEASECLKLTAEDLLAMNVIEKIIPEGQTLFENLKSELIRALRERASLCRDALVENRYQRFRRIGDLHD